MFDERHNNDSNTIEIIIILSIKKHYLVKSGFIEGSIHSIQSPGIGISW